MSNRVAASQALAAKAAEAVQETQKYVRHEL